MQMDAVADHLDLIGQIQRCADEPRTSVPERHHGVEDMGEVGRSRPIGFSGEVVIRGGMGEGDGGVTADLPDGVHGAGVFRADVEDGDMAAAGSAQTLIKIAVERNAAFLHMGALLLPGQEGTLHIDAPHHSSAGLGIFDEFPCRRESLFKNVRIGRHAGAQKTGDTVHRFIPGNGRDRLSGAVAEVRSVCSVHMDIHETGQYVPSAGVQDLTDSGRGRDDPVAFRGDGALYEAFFLQKYRSIFYNHDITPIIDQSEREDAYARTETDENPPVCQRPGQHPDRCGRKSLRIHGSGDPRRHGHGISVHFRHRAPGVFHVAIA